MTGELGQAATAPADPDPLGEGEDPPPPHEASSRAVVKAAKAARTRGEDNTSGPSDGEGVAVRAA